MKPLVLTKEGFNRIERILAKHGPMSPRDFDRRFAVWRWEIEQAAELGLVEFVVRKPPVGRPATVVHPRKNVSKSKSTELLLHAHEVPHELSIRHGRFLLALMLAPPLVRAYYQAGYRPRSYRAARACASRLAKRFHIQAGLRYVHRTGRFFHAFPEDLTLRGGGAWLAFLMRLPREPADGLRCRLSASRTLEEARSLVEGSSGTFVGR